MRKGVFCGIGQEYKRVPLCRSVLDEYLSGEEEEEDPEGAEAGLETVNEVSGEGDLQEASGGGGGGEAEAEAGSGGGNAVIEESEEDLVGGRNVTTNATGNKNATMSVILNSSGERGVLRNHRVTAKMCLTYLSVRIHGRTDPERRR